MSTLLIADMQINQNEQILGQYSQPLFQSIICTKKKDDVYTIFYSKRRIRNSLNHIQIGKKNKKLKASSP